MKTMRARLMKAGAVLAFLSCGVVGAAAAPATTVDARDLLLRLQRLERDMRDVQAETFRQTGKAPAPAAAAPPPAEAAAPPPPVVAPVMPDLDPLIRRLSEIEESVGRLTGQMEELGHQVELVSQKADRLQKQLDFQSGQGGAAGAAAGAAAGGLAANPPPPSENPNAVASLTPDVPAPTRGAPPANLGQIPANALLPTPSPARPADPKGEYDSAMNLLARAQYDPASQAFRKFADDHPDDEKASDALYWTGDIAYSAKKDYPEAARDFAELLKKYPKAQRAPEGMLKLGLALFELGQMKEGCAALAALPAKYPDATQAVSTRAKSERTNNKCK
jgi:tol-pal system protein YbgF